MSCVNVISKRQGYPTALHQQWEMFISTTAGYSGRPNLLMILFFKRVTMVFGKFPHYVWEMQQTNAFYLVHKLLIHIWSGS